MLNRGSQLACTKICASRGIPILGALDQGKWSDIKRIDESAIKIKHQIGIQLSRAIRSVAGAVGGWGGKLDIIKVGGG